MKILFLLGAASRIRNFEHAITILAERGHTLLLAGRPRKGKLELPKTLKADGVSIRENPTTRSDAWGGAAEALRGARDYVRYLDPRYSQATRLVRRAYEISPTGFVLFCERHPWVKSQWRLLSAALAWCEDLIPSDPAFEAFIRDERPDLILVTPLVTFESYQTDYVKAAHRLGIPIAFLPFSWDNLTNKGLMRILPDRVLVWNDVQRREAVELHGMPENRVVVTGAARFDDFFEKKPSMGREEFFAQYGLDPARPMVLYLGSSQLTGPNEMELVRQWAESLRRADDPILRTCGILVRPHPALKTSWVSVDLSALGNVGVSLHARRSADQELFDSLSHAHVAVGLNTSAMLEAAIVGRPVHTLMIPGFDEGQIGTMHFRYLVEAFGGLVTVARSLPEHEAQLATILSSPPVTTERSRRFAEAFLRPQGIDRRVSPLVADAIEQSIDIRKRPERRLPWRAPFSWALRSWMRRPAAAPPHCTRDESSPIATSMSLRPVRTALEELRQESGPIVVGPWLDDMAKELLYWIPFVRWAARTYGLSPDRLIVISREGARDWYGPLAGRFVIARDLFSAAEFDDWSRRTIPQSQQNPKQGVIFPFDQEILQRAAAMLDVAEPQSLHPQMWFRVMQRLEADRALSRVREMLVHERFKAPRSDAAASLPSEYVAVSLACTERLPGDANRHVLQRVLKQIAGDHDVVVVDADDHERVDALGGSIRTLKSLCGDPSPAMQTAVIAGAQAFVGAYGDLAVLASYCGVPAYGFHSERLTADQIELLGGVSADAGWGRVALVPVDEAQSFRLPAHVPA